MALAKCQLPARTLSVKPNKGNMMKRILSPLGIALTCMATQLSAQTTNVVVEPAVPDYRPFTLSLEAGTTGPGVAAVWRFTDHFGGRVGVNGFFGGSIDVGSEDFAGIEYDTDVKLMSEPLALDIYPWKKSTFRVTVGILLNQNEIEGVVPQDPVFGQTFLDIGGTSFDSASIGNLNLKIEQPAVAPYISIGMSFYLDRHKHWSLGGEVGVAYTGDPDVTLSTSTGLVPQPNLDNEAQQIEDDAWKFYPIVKVSVNYSF
jgi:hypothetical protein